MNRQQRKKYFIKAGLKNKFLISFLIVLFCMSLYGCNTIVGATKGVVEDVREIVPLI